MAILAGGRKLISETGLSLDGNGHPIQNTGAMPEVIRVRKETATVPGTRTLITGGGVNEVSDGIVNCQAFNTVIPIFRLTKGSLTNLTLDVEWGYDGVTILGTLTWIRDQIIESASGAMSMVDTSWTIVPGSFTAHSFVLSNPGAKFVRFFIDGNSGTTTGSKYGVAVALGCGNGLDRVGLNT